MKENNFEAWKKTREQGRSRFVVVRGILGWGAPMFLLMILMFNGGEKIAIHAVIWTIGGLIFGFLTWHLTEKKYLKELERRKGNNR